MRIQYTGNCTKRIVGECVWSRENGFIAQVNDLDLAMSLLAQDEFAQVAEELSTARAPTKAPSESANTVSKTKRRFVKASKTK